MPLIKTLSQTLKQDKEKFRVPKSVQQAIPIRKIWPDGIFQVENKFSRTFRFTDINYSIASKADKTEMFLDYSELLNALDSGCTAKITLNNRKINKEEFEQSLLIPMKGDGLDEYRKEYNDMLLSKISGTNNSIYQERYLTVSVHKKNIDEARTYFARISSTVQMERSCVDFLGLSTGTGLLIRIPHSTAYWNAVPSSRCTSWIVVPERNRCFCFSVSSCFFPSIYEPQGVLLRVV